MAATSTGRPMAMTPRLRKVTLTAHVTCSVGWLGADAGVLALAVVGLTSEDAQTVRGAYLAMGSIAWFVILPLSLMALLTGVVQSFGTKWGLFRHYWVLIKFVLTIFAIGVLLLHVGSISTLSDAAAEGTLSSAHVRGLRTEIMIAAGAGLVVLLINTTLGVSKPRGWTRYGRRKQHEQRRALPRTSKDANAQCSCRRRAAGVDHTPDVGSRDCSSSMSNHTHASLMSL
jgi:hypothetical protein